MLPHVCPPIPGPKSREQAALLSRYENRNVTFLAETFPIIWQRADGVNVWDVDDNRYLDLTAGFAVSAHGHTHPKIQEAIVKQSRLLLHAMGDVHPAMNKAQLCEKLSALTFERWNLGVAKTTLCNSGFEAVEVAIKTSLLHSGKPGVIAFRNGYHGLGYGALEVVGISWFREPFRSQLRDYVTLVPYPSCFRCPFGRSEGYRLEGTRFPNCALSCLESIEDQIAQAIRQREVGCIIVEPCQGRGGEIVPPLDFLRLLRSICDRHKILLIFDEIYTGFNRTGSLFACEQFGVYPDILCLGKALTTGFPLSACIGRAEMMDAWPKSAGEALHTTTFLGNPLGCAMALASIDLHLEPETAARVRKIGRYFLQQLRTIRHQSIGHIRGLGLMIGMELVDLNGNPDGNRAAQIINRGLQEGLILLGGGPDGNVLSFTPPFCISEEEVDFVTERLAHYIERT
jgi:4-aminobutyrate aminotransferase-like enzyme